MPIIESRTLSQANLAANSYLVQEGDSLWHIAEDHRIGLGELIAANPSIKNANLIYPGQKLILPNHGPKILKKPVAKGTSLIKPALKAPSHTNKHLPLWMQIAEAELALWKSGQGNARYRKYVQDVGAPSGSWCSIFANWVVQKCTYCGTRNWLASSWMHWGIPLSHPRVGAIVVVQDNHPTNPYPHVAFVRSYRGMNQIELLGGNQGGGAGAVTASMRYLGEQSDYGPIRFNYRWPPR